MPAKKKPAPASKKSAAKKSVSQAKKAATKKSTSKKASAKKAPAAKTAKKAASKKSAAKKTVTKKTAAKKATTKAAKGGGSAAKQAIERIRNNKQQQKTNSEKAARGGSGRKSAPTVFSLQDVREVLKNKNAQSKAKADSAKKAGKAPQATASKKTVTEEVPIQKSKHAAASLNDILGVSTAGKGNSQTIPKKWQPYYDMLIDLRRQVKDELSMHSSETLKRSQKDDAGDIVTSADAGTDNFDRDFALSLLSSEQEALNEIEAAIQRIYQGTYGICEVTGEPIAAERLEAVPFTRFSLEGQRQHESGVRPRVQRAGAFLGENTGDAIGFGDDDSDN